MIESKFRNFACTWIVFFALALSPGSSRAQDASLFRTNVTPNILLIVDNSKSMTNTVWHADYGKSNPAGSPVNAGGDLAWKKQDDCTEFRDAFTAAGISGNTFKIYPGGRKVKFEDATGHQVRVRSNNNNKPWEPRVLDYDGTPLWNDVNANGINDFATDSREWDAYYRTCDPTNPADYNALCMNLPDLDGDGNPGVYVRDSNGNIIYDTIMGTGLPLIYKSDPGNSTGLGVGSGSKVNVRTTITPREVAVNMGIDPSSYAFSGSICGVNPSGWSLFQGESAAETPSGSTVTFKADYLDFLFSSPYGDVARPAVFAPTVANDGVRSISSCIGSGSFDTYRRTRLMALRLVLQTVTCELRDDVRFGLMQFRFHGKPGDDNGGYVALPIESLEDGSGNPTTYSLNDADGTRITASHADHLTRIISKVGPDAQTPLNETLYQAYSYFMSRDSTQLPPGRDHLGDPIATGEVFPVYEYNMDLHNPLPDDGGDLNLPGGAYVGSGVTTTHPKPGSRSNLNADGLDPDSNGGLAWFPGWDSNPAPDPVQWSCQKNFVLLITDGGSSGDRFDDVDALVNANFVPPVDIETGTDRGYAEFFALIGDHYRNPDGTPDEVEFPTGSKSSKYMDDIAYFMTRHDFRPDLDGDQTIDVYTVGYSVESTGVSNVELAALHGNGLYFESADADQLATDIVSAFGDIIEKAQSFTSATVPASRTTDGANFYSSFFLPKESTGFWEGHLKNFEFTGEGDIVASDGSCATGPVGNVPPGCAAGTLRTSAPAFWDAAEEIPDPANRNLYVGFSDHAFGTQPVSWDSVDKVALDVQASDLSVAPYSGVTPSGATLDEDDVADAIIAAYEGCDLDADVLSTCTVRTNETGGRSILGDIFHSNPIVVGSPNSAINEDAYGTYANANRTRSRVIYTGANDGFLHAFNSGDWQTLEADGVTPLVPPRHGRGTGEEYFGFMPYSIRNVAKVLPTRQGAGRGFETVDGSPQVSDAWFYRDISSGNLGSVNPTLRTADKVADQWRTVLISGLRNGGRSPSASYQDGGKTYYALDVTNPPVSGAATPSNYPLYLWEFPCEDCTETLTENKGTDVEIPWMGFTWSDPVITRVRVQSDTTVDPEGYERWVAIFGAGYHDCGDPLEENVYKDNPVAGDACFGNQPKGRAVYMVDITTGKVLAKKVWSPTAVKIPAGTGTQIGFPEMRYAFPSAPSVFDLDFDGFADVIYIGDLGGNIWKWVVTDIGDDPINNSTSDNNVAQPNWPFRLFFKAGSTASPIPAAFNAGYPYQSFYFPPTGVLRYGELVLALGAGQRSRPYIDSSDWDSDGLAANNNHYYVLKDEDPLRKRPTPPALLTGYLSEDTLADNVLLDSLNPSTCSSLSSYDGYFLTGVDNEMFISNSVVFIGELFFGSYLPPNTSVASTDPCTASGESFLWRFDIDCGGGAYPANPGTGNEDRHISVGTGLPTRPRVSVGGLNEGDEPASCNNKVVVITSDGGIVSECQTLPSRGVNVRSWRER